MPRRGQYHKGGSCTARGETGADRKCGRRDHEYRRHLNRVEIHDLVGYGAGEGERRRIQQPFGPGTVSGDDSARYGGRGEQHGEEQKPAAEKDRGEEAVFKLSQAVAQHADEPSKGNAGEWYQVQRQSDFVRAGLKPRTRLQRIGPGRKPEQ